MIVYLVVDVVGDWQPLHIASSREAAESWIADDMRDNGFRERWHYRIWASKVDGDVCIYPDEATS